MNRMLTRAVLAAVTIASAAVLVAGQEAPPPPAGLPPLPPPVLPLVTTQDLLDGLKHPGRWLTYSGDYSGKRHSPLKQITVDNVHRLAAQWTWQAEGMAQPECGPSSWDQQGWQGQRDFTAAVADALDGKKPHLNRKPRKRRRKRTPISRVEGETGGHGTAGGSACDP